MKTLEISALPVYLLGHFDDSLDCKLRQIDDADWLILYNLMTQIFSKILPNKRRFRIELVKTGIFFLSNGLCQSSACQEKFLQSETTHVGVTSYLVVTLSVCQSLMTALNYEDSVQSRIY